MRGRGGFIGANVTPATAGPDSAASGVWTLREAESLKRAGTWPTIAPGGVSAGLQLWLDASEASTLFDATSGGSLVAANGTIARWQDKSGNARHATQATSGNAPTRIANAQNGRDVVRFAGSFMTVSGSASAFSFLHYSTSTVFVASKIGTQSRPNAAYVVLSTCPVLSNTVGAWLAFDDRAPSFNSRIRYVVTKGSGFVTSSGVDFNYNANVFSTFSLVNNVADATASNRVTFRAKNGTAENSNTLSTAPVSTTATADLTIGQGAGASDSSLYFTLTGDIGEIIIYNTALSDTDRNTVEKYLLAKWGVS